MSSSVLHLEDIRSFDPGHLQGHASRHACPFCGGAKPIDFAHRSLILDIRTGCYTCFRCGSKGRLGDFTHVLDIDWNQINEQRRLEIERKRRAVTHLLDSLLTLSPRRGGDYLEGRGICLGLAAASGVGFSLDYFGKPALIFPVQDKGGLVCAVQGRYLDSDASPRMRTLGSPGIGLFSTPAALASPFLMICEAPIDALSLHTLGWPAVAAQGTNLPQRFLDEARTPAPDAQGRLRIRPVYIATDNDEAGEKAYARWKAQLKKQGTPCARHKPENFKDWNDVLMASND